MPPLSRLSQQDKDLQGSPAPSIPTKDLNAQDFFLPSQICVFLEEWKAEGLQENESASLPIS